MTDPAGNARRAVTCRAWASRNASIPRLQKARQL